ncbi:MAG: dihydropyrimidinase [Anaerolineaceae bacterium]|nr:dihydropyrimidinase [Anaerolineaceae bacterium]
MGILIKSGNIITSSETYTADILIEGEKIVAIGRNLKIGAETQIINAEGKNVLPGGVDVHTHFDLPMFGTVSSDDHYTGHKAAAFGGTTTVIDFISQDKASLLENVEIWHRKADEKAAIDFSFHMNITQFNGKVVKEIPLLRKEGINSLKVFTAYNGRLRLQDGEIYQVLRIARDNGLLVMVHAENGDVIEYLVAEALLKGHTTPEWHAYTRPTLGAVESVYRIISFAEQTNAPVYIVHMNTKGGVEHLHNARMAGLPIMGETCPQYLFFTSDDLKKEDGAKWICSPPMRSKSDNAGIWQAVMNGTIQVISTDHCPFFYDGTKSIEYEGQKIAMPGKELGKGNFTKIPNGLPGVGDRLLILWSYGVGSGKITANQFVEITSTNPAKIFGLYPKKGTLLPGSDADITIWNPYKEIDYGIAYSKHRTDYNLFEGWKLKGTIEKVFLRGKLIVDSQKWLGKKGMGEYLYCGDITIL